MCRFERVVTRKTVSRGMRGPVGVATCGRERLVRVPRRGLGARRRTYVHSAVRTALEVYGTASGDGFVPGSGGGAGGSGSVNGSGGRSGSSGPGTSGVGTTGSGSTGGAVDVAGRMLITPEVISLMQ